MGEVDLSHPAVAGVVDVDGDPAMILVFGIGRIECRFAGEILDAGVGDSPGPGAGGEAPAAEL